MVVRPSHKHQVELLKVEKMIKAEQTNVGSVDGGGPPEGESSVGDLVETGSLGVGELLVLHALLESGGFLPEETFPSGKVSSFEESVLQDSLDAAQRLNHVRPVVVEIPEFSVVPLMCPPERILLEHLILLEIGSHAPSFVVGQGVSIL